MEPTETAPADGTGTINLDEGSSTSSTQSVSDYETLAREKGWKPKEEYEGDPEVWVGAEEFIKRQPLFDKIKTQSKRLKELEKTVEALGKYYQINIQQAKEKAIADLKAQRREAIEVGDAVTVDQIDQKIDHVKAIPEPDIQPKGMAPEIEKFVSDNSTWFNKDEEMTSFAVAYNENYLRKHPDDLDKSLEETLKAVKKAFPEKFVNQRKTNPPAVEGAATPNTGAGKYNMNRLSSEQKFVYNQLVKVHKQMSHDDYFKSLEEAGYLEG